ncbi:MAG: hypothetical protein JXP34_14410 [Planctomycetes bacterium]|nr:hypothetical protein [Planctomycetota bacterium]
MWGELRGANPLAGDYPFRVFTVADQTIGGVRFRAGEERVVLEELSFVSRLVEKRKPIEGVPLDVGEPVFVDRAEKTTLSFIPGRDYGLDIRIGDGRGHLRCRLRVSAAKRAESK